MKQKQEKLQIKNSQRRKFLKYSLIAGGGFLAGKFFDSVLGVLSPEKPSLMGFEPHDLRDKQTHIFQNFVVQETDKELNFFDKEGYKIFVIEK